MARASTSTSTSTSKIVPCVWLDDQAEAAAAFYARTFPGGRVVATSRYPESGDNPGGKRPGSVLTVEVELAGQRFTLLNGGPIFAPNPSISFFVHVATPARADRLFARLAEGGEALMPLGAYPWSPRYGWVKDRFGVSWQVMAGRRPRGSATNVPCLMFSGAQHGRAEAAMRAYASAFPRSRVVSLERYAAGEGPEGTVKHGRFVLAGQPLVAMDSHLAHDITFGEGLSLQVMCRDQREVDRYWAVLARGGRHSQCGWLEDRFGLSWQVVPRSMVRCLVAKDVQARDRAFRAMMTMKKPLVARLQRAFLGR